MKTQHTPTPWRFYDSHENDCHIETASFDTKERHLAEMGGSSKEVKEANAAFIVRACNSHDALVTALEDAIRQIESSVEFNAPIKKSFGVKNLVENKLRKALAKATEGK